MVLPEICPGRYERDRGRVALELVDTDETRKIYPYSFKLNLVVEVRDGELIHQMTIANTGDKPMPTAYGSHPYFYMPISEKPDIKLNIDDFNPSAINWEEVFDERFNNSGDIDVKTTQRSFSLKTDPEKFPHLAIWSLPDKDFICIEPWSRLDGALEDISIAVLINPGEGLTYKLTISVTDNKIV